MPNLTKILTNKFFKVLIAIYVGLFTLIWLASSPVIKHFATPIIAEQNLHLADEASIRFNPFLMSLTFSDIKLSQLQDPKQEIVLSIDELTVQVALWQLLFDRIVISNFLLEQGLLKVTHLDKHLVVAGVEIPTSSSEDEAIEVEQTEEATVEVETAPTTSFPYQFVLPNFLISQFEIDIERDTLEQKSKAHHIVIEELALNQIKATETAQEGNVTIKALVDKTQLALTANAQLVENKGDIRSSFSLSNYPMGKLTRYVEELKELSGTLSFKSNQTITLDDAATRIRVQRGNVTIQNLLARLAEQHVSLNKLSNEFNNIEVDLQAGDITHLAGNSSFNLIHALVGDNKTQDTIASFNKLSIDDINFILDDEPSIDIKDIILDEFLFSKKAKLTDEVAQKAIDKINQLSEEDGIEIAAEELVKLPPVMKLHQLSVNHLHIHKDSLAINSIIFDSLTGDVIVKENKELGNLVSLGAKPAESNDTTETQPVDSEDNKTDEADATSTEQTKAKFTFSLNELRFINDNHFNFNDFSVDPIYSRTLYLDTLEVGALSSAEDKKQELTPFSLTGRSNKYANFNLAGTLQPFTDVPKYHITGDFKEFSLPAISSYLKESTGLEVTTGQLNTELDVKLNGDELDGNVVILIQALETGVVDSEEAGNLIDQGALPLNMAMGMLKDSDGNVELDVPLSGSTSDPSFGLSSIVTLITKKAIYSATQDYLMTTFVPYANIVSVAITAGEFALKLRFDDLMYQEKQISLDQSQAKYLSDFITLMKEKEDTRVRICAISTPADIGLAEGVPVTDQKQIKKLLELGEKREHAFKDYMIEQGNIKSARILFCKPQIDSDEGAKPRMEISV